MKESKDPLRLPTEEEFKELQKQDPNVTLLPIDKASFEKGREAFQTAQQEAEEFPIMEMTEQSVDLFAAQQELKRERSLFIQKLEYTPIKVAIQDWLRNLQDGTRRNYAYYMTDMLRRRIIPEFDGNGEVFTVGHFNHIPHEKVIDKIKMNGDWGEGTRQVRAACYISLTTYLRRISQGWFRKAEASTLASNKTFYSVRDKCKTNALSLHGWHLFVASLYKINERDALIAKTMLQGAKRISEALSLSLDQIDFDNRIIHFRQSKTGGTIREIPITYPESFMRELKDYIEKTKAIRGDNDTVFITRNGKRIYRTHLNNVFKKASILAKLPKITPHVLRATWVTLAKEQGIPDSEIMKVTGHTSSKMIYSYDKTSAINNYSKKLVLV